MTVVPTTRFPTSPLRFRFREVDDRAGKRASQLPLLSVSVERGVVLRNLEDGGQAPSEDVSHYKVCSTDDVAINKLRAFQGGLGVAPQTGMISPAYAVLRFDDRAHPRYVHYLMRSHWFVGQMTARVRGVGGVDVHNARTPHINVSDIGLIDAPEPPLDTQRRIAAMLDAETARIDTLIEKNERVLGLLERRWQSLLEYAIFGNESVRRSPLWLACDITPGYAFRSDEFQQAGPMRLLRGINVGVGTIDWNDVVYANEATVAPAAEYRLKAGDLVVGMDRPWISSGLRVARIAPEDEPAYLVQRVARVRPRPGLDQNYLYLALQSRKFYAAFEPVMTGVSVPHVSGGQIGAFRVPMPDLDAQRRLTAELDTSWQRSARMRAAVDRQQELLRLRRQALITAAVTGQIDV